MAQLGARFHGMEEVTGSIPVRSTKHPPTISPAWLRYPEHSRFIVVIPMPIRYKQHTQKTTAKAPA